jgi:Response regulator containing a CheY-like receiver domain and an HTH DNA-binding domain
MNKPRLLLADDHTMVLEGFRRLLEPDYELVGAVEDGEALVKLAQETKPDLILLDISMPLLNGIEAARQIRKVLPDVKFIFLTMHTDPHLRDGSL